MLVFKNMEVMFGLADEKLIENLVFSDTYKSLTCFLDDFDHLITYGIGLDCTNDESADVFNESFFGEVKEFCDSKAVLSFGKTLRDIKCVISDRNFKDHVVWIEYMGPKKMRVRDMDLPRSYLQDQVYKSIDEVVNVFKKRLHELSNYFEELDQIDLRCTVVEPIRPTIKDNYRKVYLADKIWLHVEVSPEGSAKNLTVVGQFDQREIQELLQAWDHDKDIASNVLTIKSSLSCEETTTVNQKVTVPDCAICYCVELPGDSRVPLPLCKNSKCGAYYHTTCLYEWFVASAGGRTPQFGVGKCPRCSEYIQCSDGDKLQSL